MAFNPNQSYTTATDADGNLFIYQGGVIYDRFGNSWSSTPNSATRGLAPVAVGLGFDVIGTWATLFASTSMTRAGAMALCTDLISPGYCMFVSNGTVWKPLGMQCVYRDTTTVTGTQTTGEQVLKSVTIPAGLFYMQRVRVDGCWGKTGTTDAYASAQLRLGTTGTTSDTSLAAGTSSFIIAGKRSCGVSMEFESTSATSLAHRGSAGSLDNGAWISSAVAGAMQASTTVSNMQTGSTKLSFSSNMSTAAADSPMVGEIFIYLLP